VALPRDFRIRIFQCGDDPRYAGAEMPLRFSYIGNAYRAVRPQRGQDRTVSRVALMARAILSGCWPRDWTIQSAMRSAERGPIPGICRNCAINSRIAEGYSVFLKTGASLLRRAAQLQGQGLEPAKIQLQRPVLFSLGTARALKLRIRFGPAFLAIKDHAVPKGVAPRDDLPRSIQSQRDRLVNFVPLADINAALEKAEGLGGKTIMPVNIPVAAMGVNAKAKDPDAAIKSVMKRNETGDEKIELERLKMSLRDNFVTPWVKANGVGDVDMARLAKSIDQIAPRAAMPVRSVPM
jgi:hypothetical protein